MIPSAMALPMMAVPQSPSPVKRGMLTTQTQSPMKRPSITMAHATIQDNLNKIQQAINMSLSGVPSQTTYVTTPVQDAPEDLTFPDLDELCHMGPAHKQGSNTLRQMLLPPPMPQSSSVYINNKHIYNIRVRYLPDYPTETVEVSKIRMRNWLKKNCNNFLPDKYPDCYQLANTRVESQRQQRISRTWVVVTNNTEDRDVLKANDDLVHQTNGYVRIVYDYTNEAFVHLLKTKPQEVGINRRPN